MRKMSIKTRQKELVIYIGRDADVDDRQLFENYSKGRLQPGYAIYFDSCAQLVKFLPAKKLDLLCLLMGYNKTGEKKSMGIIAKELGRKQEAISRDLHHLEAIGIVSLEKSGVTVYPSTGCEKINIELAAK